MKKTALITGITGQDGSLLAKFLLKKNYVVHGMKRRSSSLNTERIDDVYKDFHEKNAKLFLHYGDLTDSSNIISLVNNIRPDEIYNLGAQSHVKVSFETPEYTANCDAIGALRILEAIRILNLNKKTKFYQASTSEMFGNARPPQNEKTPFDPISPYGTAKLYAHFVTKNYRQAYGIFASSGILFNHESSVRGETFVTKKIITAAVKILIKKQKQLFLGNLDAIRDWGHAEDYVRGMWLILQHNKPDDFVLATGKSYSIRKFVEIVFSKIGIKIIWSGKGVDEKGINKKTGEKVILIDKKYFRPNEVNNLRGDYSKARKILKWKPKISFRQLIDQMIKEEINKNNFTL
jgi:GDPmannose 4,6-dehydratase